MQISCDIVDAILISNVLEKIVMFKELVSMR